jgi:hypothetical protein
MRAKLLGNDRDSAQEPWRQGRVFATSRPGLVARAGRRNVVRGGLAAGLHENRQVEKVTTIPGGPWLQELQALAIGLDAELNLAVVLWRRDLRGVACFEISRRDLRRRFGCPKAEGLPIGSHQGLGQRVERESAGKSHGGHDLGAADEVHRLQVAGSACYEPSAGCGPSAHRRATQVSASTQSSACWGTILPQSTEDRGHRSVAP